MTSRVAPSASPSRLNPVYLARRHGGMAFFLLALGVFLGVAYRMLAQPTLYQSSLETSVAARPAEAAAAFAWDDRERSWRSLLTDPEMQTLLDNNLRYVVKLALVHDLAPDPESLAAELTLFAPVREYSSDLFPSGRLESLGATFEVSRRDVASNIDFQSLAAIVSDLEPPKTAKSWDFTFFRDGSAEAARGMQAFMIVRPGPEDRFFRVFYHLHALLHPQDGNASPEAVWRTAVEEVAERLERESRFSGGGGFGVRARRELARELAALPALAANRLYRAAAWNRAGERETRSKRLWAERWSRDVGLFLTRYGAASGVLTVRAELGLYPLFAPRDTVFTRITPMMAAVVEASIAALERPAASASSGKATKADAVAAPSSTLARERMEKAAKDSPAEAEQETKQDSNQETRQEARQETKPDAILEANQGTGQGTRQEMNPATNPATEAGARANAPPSPESPPPSSSLPVAAPEPTHRETVRILEDAALAARLARDGALRRLDASRLDENRLTLETLAARSRADRLRERYDEAMVVSSHGDAVAAGAGNGMSAGAGAGVGVGGGEAAAVAAVETAELLLERDAIQARLTRLLEYCTEEHPFVRQARRDLAAVETLLAKQAPAKPAAPKPAAGNARLSALRAEWEIAASAADSLEERLRRQVATTKDALNAMTRVEKELADREAELSRARDAATGRGMEGERRTETAAQTLPSPALATESTMPLADDSPSAGGEKTARQAVLAFANQPTLLATTRTAPPWDSALVGAALGCVAALAWVVFREALTFTFTDAFEARRLAHYPLLASLPAYDAGALRAAAKTVKGDLRLVRRGKAVFIPVPVEFSEPQPAARRGAILPAGRRVRWAAWVCGLALLVAGATLVRLAGHGVFQPRAAFPGDMTLPPASAYDLLDPEDEDSDWGNLP